MENPLDSLGGISQAGLTNLTGLTNAPPIGWGLSLQAMVGNSNEIQRSTECGVLVDEP